MKDAQRNGNTKLNYILTTTYKLFPQSDDWLMRFSTAVDVYVDGNDLRFINCADLFLCSMKSHVWSDGSS